MNNYKIDLKKNLYTKESYSKIIDSKFRNLGVKTYEESVKSFPSIDEFFENYDLLFYEIPQFGEVNSHEYLAKKSGEYAEYDKDLDIIKALQEEITYLREENLKKDLEILKLETGNENIDTNITSSVL